MRTFWLFQTAPDGLSKKRQAVFWLWNLGVLLAAGLSLGWLSMFFAYGDYPDTIMKTYFQHPLILFMNIAPVVLALGPGFTAGVDCHGVVETMRGHDLGRLLTRGSAAPNTGVPGDVGGYTTQRIIRVPADGAFEPLAAIGQRVEEGQPVARVAGRTACAQLTGVVRGMLPAGLAVTSGMKAGDIDPRCRAEHCFTVSDKARAIGGGVLEGLLYFERRAGLWSV